jgi:hypothetical protein
MQERQLFNNLQIFPNPATDYITNQYNLTSPKETTVLVFNIYGQKVSPTCILPGGEEPTHQPGRREMKIDMRNFPAGIYFVKVSADGKEVRKIVKL